MPAATPHCADPATWADPTTWADSETWTDHPFPDSRLEEIREHLPVFDPRTTPTEMGAISESFRTWPGTLRSHHPLESVCARGPAAPEIVREHPLAFSEGPGSPFAKLHDLDCVILLLGVGFNRCTALHFAESLVAKRRTMTVRFPWMEDGRRVWVEVPNMADDNGAHFPMIGDQYMSAGRARRGTIAEATSMLFPMRDLVTFAREYFASALSPCPEPTPTR